jgi:hypothetical protein
MQKQSNINGKSATLSSQADFDLEKCVVGLRSPM